MTTSGVTYAVPEASSFTTTSLPRTIALEPISLIAKTVTVNLTVMSGDTPATTVPNAEVTLSDGYLLNPKQSSTDANGLATFSEIPPGSYAVTIKTDNGFTSQQQLTVEFSLNTNGTQASTLYLTSGTGNIDISVGGNGTNSGLSGATVTDVTSGRSCVTAGSGASVGVCTISDLNSGPHRFRITHQRFEMVETADVIIQGGRTVSTSVSLGATTGDVRLTALNAVSGAVLDGVTFDPSANGKSNCTSNPCTFTELPLAPTNFVVSKIGYEDAYVSVSVTSGPLTQLSVSMIPSNTNTLDITVYDSITRQIIQGVAVTRDGTTVCNAQTPNETDGTGICTGVNQAAGQFTLKATKSGYEDTYATASIISRKNTKVIISMRPTTTSFFLYVKDGSRNFAGVDGASILMPPNSGTCSAVDGIAGKYQCINVPLRSLDIKVTKSPDYIEAYINVTPTLSEVAENGATVVMTSTTATDALTVTVVNSVDSSPIAGINVNECALVTDGFGKCTKTSMATGSYSLVASSPGSAAQQYESGYSTVTIGSSGSSSATISMRPITTDISVTIIDVNQNFVGGATVTPSSGTCGLSNTNGVSTCTNMPTTSVNFTVTKDPDFSTGYATLTPSLAKSTTIGGLIPNIGKIILTPKTSPKVLNVILKNAANGNTITDSIIVDVPGQTSCTTVSGACTFTNVDLGQITVTASNIDSKYETSYANVAISPVSNTTATIALRPKTDAITVNVFDTSGSALAGASVSFGTSWTSSCTGTGPFTCSGLTSSSIPLRVSKDGYIKQYISAYTGTGPVSVTLIADPAPGSLTLTVVDQANQSIANPIITVVNAAGTSQTCTVDANSSNVYACPNLGVGQYLVSASKDGENGFGTVSMTSGSSTSVKIVVRSVSAAPTAAAFTLSVFDPSFGKISGATIEVKPDGGSCSATSTSGDYLCTGLSLVPTSFRVSKDPTYDATYVNVTPTSSTGGFARVVLPATLASTNTLTVTVRDATTSGLLSGVAVTNCSTETNASGVCSGTGLAVGPVSITATKDKYEPAYASVTISSTGVTSLTIAMRPTDSPFYFNIYDSRTGALVTADVLGVAATKTICTAGNCDITPSTKTNKNITISADGYRSATATVAYNGYPVTLTIYLTPVANLTINFPAMTETPSTTIASYNTVTISISGTSYSCTGTTTCSILEVPYGTYNFVATYSSGPTKTATATVIQSTQTVTIS